MASLDLSPRRINTLPAMTSSGAILKDPMTSSLCHTNVRGHLPIGRKGETHIWLDHLVKSELVGPHRESN